MMYDSHRNQLNVNSVRIIEVKGPSRTYFKEIDYVYEVLLLSSLKQLLSDEFILGEVCPT